MLHTRATHFLLTSTTLKRVYVTSEVCLFYLIIEIILLCEQLCTEQLIFYRYKRPLAAFWQENLIERVIYTKVLSIHTSWRTG